MGPEELDDLLTSIRAEGKKERSTLALYKGTRGTDLVNESIDERVVNILGLGQVFDIDYATYLTLLKEKLVQVSMGGGSLAREEQMLLQDEFRRVRGKVGRFKINRRTASDTTYTLLTTIDSNISTYTDSDVVEGTTYFYAVSAINTNGSSRFSNPVNITVDATAPTVTSIVPAANSTVGRDARSLTVNFSEPVKWDSSPFTISFTKAGTENTDITLVRGCDLYGNCDTDSNTIQSWNTTLVGSAEVILNDSQVTISIDSSKIKDANGISMSSDFTATYTVDY